MSTARWSLWTLLLGSLLAAAAAAGAQTPTVDRAELDRVENLSESLANDLLRLSVAARDRDARRMAAHFAERVRLAGAPEPPSAPEPTPFPWLSHLRWRLDPAERIASAAEAVSSLGRMLARFARLEDARFKVKRSSFEPAPGSRAEARVNFFLVGRDAEGRRRWLRGWVGVTAEPRQGESWAIDGMRFESVDSWVAARDLFVEVAQPAGVAETFPDFGVAPNDTVVAHGAAVADVDGDGLVDLLTTGVERNVLYRNRGDGTFEDVSEETLLHLTRPATGAAFFDADGDGDEDLFLASVGRQMYLENRLVPDGRVRFLDSSVRAGVDQEAIGFSVAVADVNGDARPDVYVTSYNRYGLVMPNAWHRATNGTPNLLFINLGDGRFREEAARWGVRDSRWSYAASFADLDGDGDQDLYVANDFGENALYLNEGDHFRDVAAHRGVLDPGNGMGVSFGDYDNDGNLDLHVTNMSSTVGNRILARLFPDADPGHSVLKKIASGNSLYRGDGHGGFVNRTFDLGGFSAGWAWGGGFIDVDNDGWEDLYAPNGFISGKTMNDT